MITKIINIIAKQNTIPGRVLYPSLCVHF